MSARRFVTLCCSPRAQNLSLTSSYDDNARTVLTRSALVVVKVAEFLNESGAGDMGRASVGIVFWVKLGLRAGSVDEDVDKVIFDSGLVAEGADDGLGVDVLPSVDVSSPFRSFRRLVRLNGSHEIVAGASLGAKFAIKEVDLLFRGAV